MRKALAVAAAATLTLMLGACGAGGSGGGTADGREEVTLTFVTGVPEQNAVNDGFWIFRDKLQEKAPWVKIDYRGGPEVVAPTQLVEGVASGAYDGGHLPGDYYVGQLPAMELQRFTPYSPTEERENGIAELYQAVHEPLGVHYVGHTHSGVPQIIMLKDRIDTPNLAGKSVRTSAATSAVVQALGGTPVEMPGGEVFTALERGVIQGTTWTSVGATDWGFEKQTRYYLAPRFYDSVANTVINQDKWDSLDPETQEAITETIEEVEPQIFDHYQNLAIEETKKWNEAGMEEIVFSGADEQRILEIAYVEAWDKLDWNRIVSQTPEAEQIRAKFQEAYDDNLAESVPGGTRMQVSQ